MKNKLKQKTLVESKIKKEMFKLVSSKRKFASLQPSIKKLLKYFKN